MVGHRSQCFAKRIGSLIEPECSPILHPARVVQGPDDAPEDVGGKDEGSSVGDELQVHARPGAERTCGFEQGPACAQVHDRDDTAGAERGSHGRQKSRRKARIFAPIDQRLVHVPAPGSNFITRVRAVAPSTRTAYWARRPWTYRVPDVAVPSGAVARMRAEPIRIPSVLGPRTPSASGSPACRPNFTPGKRSDRRCPGPIVGSTPERISAVRTPLPLPSTNGSKT